MAADEPRIDALERRVRRLEVHCGLAAGTKPPAAERDARDLPAPAPAAAPDPAPASARVEREQHAVARFVQAPGPLPRDPRRPAGPAPRRARSLEVDLGRWMLSRLGALALVVAAGFLFHYAARQGWLGPRARVALGATAAVVLLALGERLHARLAQYAAALTGAGVAILLVCVYAGHALYGFWDTGPALLFAAAGTALGVVQALRHRVEAIAGLAAAGGFLAPLLVLDLQADPWAVLGYLLVLNAGLALVRHRTGWRAPEILSWIATPVLAIVPLIALPLGAAIGFLVAHVAVFAAGPRARGEGPHPVHTGLLALVTATIGWVVFARQDADGWWAFAGALALLLGWSAVAGARRGRAAADAEIVYAVILAAAALIDAFVDWELAVAGAGLAAVLLRAPWGRLAATTRRAGVVVAGLVLAYAAGREAVAYGFSHVATLDGRLAALLAAAAALAAIPDAGARFGGAFVAALGIGAQVAIARGVEPWGALALVHPLADAPTARLLAGGTVALLVGVAARVQGRDRWVRLAAAWLGALLACEGMLLLDGGPHVVPGAFAAALLLAFARPGTVLPWAAVALAFAATFDLLPPPDFVPLLNRRVLALGGVLLAAGWHLRAAPERRAVVLVALLVAAAELASLPAGGTGAFPWRPLWFDLRLDGAPAALWNTRFLFLLGAAGAARFAAARWRGFLPVAHVYLLAGLGAEAVGLVTPALRAHPLSIFGGPGSTMAEHLVLTGVVLAHGTGLVLAGLRRDHAVARRTGLAFLVAGALKVSLVDLTGLGDLYRVGSFVVLGGTFLFGSYAYHRFRTGAPGPDGPGAPGEPTA